MPNENERPWYKSPAIMVVIAAIIGAIGVIIAAYIGIIPFMGPELATIQGIVTDNDGKPVIGAVVEVDGSSVTTGSDGRYVIHGVPINTKTITVRAPGAEVIKRALRVPKGAGIIMCDITLPPPITPPPPTPTPTITLTPTITPTPMPTPTVTDKIGITLEIRGNTAYGTVTSVTNYDDYRVVVYVETDKLYVQPVIDPPSARFRVIDSDDSWDCSGMHIEYGGVVRAFLIKEGSNALNTLPIGAEPDGVVARARKIL